MPSTSGGAHVHPHGAMLHYPRTAGIEELRETYCPVCAKWRPARMVVLVWKPGCKRHIECLWCRRGLTLQEVSYGRTPSGKRRGRGGIDTW